MRNDTRQKGNENRRLGCRSAIWGWLVALILFLLLILLLILRGLDGFGGPDIEVCDPQDHATLRELEPIRVADNAAYVPNQLIITGSEADIEQVWERMADNEPAFDGTQCLNKIAVGGDGDRLDSDLYAIPPQLTEWEAVAAVYQAAIELSSEGEKVRVFADPNYVLGMPLEGDPVNGHGGLIGSIDLDGGIASPAMSTAVQASGNAFADFQSQWALEIMGGWQEEGGDVDVEVAIFDTASYGEGTYTIGAVDGFAGYQLSVQEPVALAVEGLDVSMAMFEPLDVSDHGVFAAGLVKAIAPDTSVVLVRVLNDTGQGTLRDLIAGLEAYGSGRIGSNGDLTNTIINLSLGMGYKRPQIPAEVATLMDRMARFDDPICQEYLAPDNRVPSLQNQLAKMRDAGAVVIAASGNDSLHDPFQPMQNPANFDGVVGVAATNIQGAPSCFTNAGQLSAPGGDGDTGGGLCQPKQITAICADQGGQCEWALISTVNPATYPSGYAYWIGTSFSTPLVAGVAARVMAETSSTLPDQVEATLMCAATGTVQPLGVSDVNAPTGAGIPVLRQALADSCSGR